jgi:hypothetical protein
MWITQQNSYAGWKIASGGFAALTTLDSGYYGKGTKRKIMMLI